MCIDIGTVLGVVSTGLNVWQQLRSGRDVETSYDAQAAASVTGARRALLDAQAVKEAAADQAGRVRILAREAVNTARARYSASGVRVDVGTAMDVQQDIAVRGEEDALNVILFGERQRRRLEQEAAGQLEEAGQFTQAGNNARSQGRVNAVASAISGGADVYTRWKSIR